MYPREVPQEFRSSVSNDGTKVSLAAQGLESVPEWLGDLTTLTTLNLSRNQLTAVPEWVGNLTALTTLHLDGNRLTAVPKSLGNLTALTTLYLSGNQVTALPNSLGNLASLTTLNLGGNRLTAVPNSLGNLVSLTTLDLDSNRLTAVPKSLGNLTALTELRLGGNQLTAVPKSLGNLTALTRLDLAHNRLTALPKQLADLITRGLELKLTGNPLAVVDLASSAERIAWDGELLDRAWMRLRSLYVPSVSLAAVLAAAKVNDSASAVLQLYTWERDRLLTLAKGAAGAAITVLTGLIATAVEGKVVTSAAVLFLAAALVAGLLFWGGFLLTGLRRLAEEYTTALDLKE